MVFADAHLFFTDDVHDLMLVGGFQPVEVLMGEIGRQRMGSHGDGS